MNSKTILSLATATIFSVSMLGIAFASGHDVLSSYSVTGNGAKTVTFTASANVPTDGSGGNFGFGVFAEKGVVVAVSHPVAIDSVAQPPVEAFHSHLVQLETPTADCTSSIAVASLTKHEVGKVSVSGNQVTIKNVPPGQSGDLTGQAVSFTLSLENGRVCVNPTATVP